MSDELSKAAARVERAKKQTRVKWEALLSDVPKIRLVDFKERADSMKTCGFCQEYMGQHNCAAYCPLYLARKGMTRKTDRLKSNNWRKGATRLCRALLLEVDKVKP